MYDRKFNNKEKGDYTKLLTMASLMVRSRLGNATVSVRSPCILDIIVSYHWLSSSTYKYSNRKRKMIKKVYGSPAKNYTTHKRGYKNEVKIHLYIFTLSRKDVVMMLCRFSIPYCLFL